MDLTDLLTRKFLYKALIPLLLLLLQLCLHAGGFSENTCVQRPALHVRAKQFASDVTSGCVASGPFSVKSGIRMTRHQPCCFLSGSAAITSKAIGAFLGSSSTFIVALAGLCSPRYSAEILLNTSKSSKSVRYTFCLRIRSNDVPASPRMIFKFSKICRSWFSGPPPTICIVSGSNGMQAVVKTRSPWMAAWT